MPLSCSCDYDYEPEYGQRQVAWWDKNFEFDFNPLKTKKRKRCCSCGELIDIGSLCIEYPVVRYPNNEIEARILGQEDDWEEPNIPMAPIYHCEKCGEIYLNLTEVGFECLYPEENMAEMLKDYRVEYAPPKLVQVAEI